MMERLSKATLMQNKDSAIVSEVRQWGHNGGSEGFIKPKRLLRKKALILQL